MPFFINSHLITDEAAFEFVAKRDPQPTRTLETLKANRHAMFGTPDEVMYWRTPDELIPHQYRIERYSYVNTRSSAGSPKRVILDLREIDHVTSWSNAYGNPSYVYHMRNGDTHYLVDDYGAMNHVRARLVRVRRRSDLFDC